MSAEDTSADKIRDQEVATRLAGEFFVRGVEILAKAHEGDLLRGIIFTAIAVANGETAPVDGGPRELRPVSVMSISSSIGVPYETTRRYVNMLVDNGLCVRMGRRGVVVTEDAFQTPLMFAAYQETYTSFNRLVSALRRARFGALTV
ncbi:MAG: hypothetical protein V4466_17080 [Pseudomonadota bacterium]